MWYKNVAIKDLASNNMAPFPAISKDELMAEFTYWNDKSPFHFSFNCVEPEYYRRYDDYLHRFYIHFTLPVNAYNPEFIDKSISDILYPYLIDEEKSDIIDWYWYKLDNNGKTILGHIAIDVLTVYPINEKKNDKWWNRLYNKLMNR